MSSLAHTVFLFAHRGLFCIAHSNILYHAKPCPIWYNRHMKKKQVSGLWQDRPLRMLAHLDMRHAASREAVGGIMRFAATHHNWEVQFAGAHPSNKSLEHFADWHPDALVIDSSCHSLAPKELAAIAGRATVFAETAVPAGWRRPWWSCRSRCPFRR